VRPKPIEYHHLTLTKRGCQKVLADVDFKVLRESVVPSTLMEVPLAPWRVMAAMRVVFLPRFFGTLPWVLFPFGALALRRLMEV